MADDLVATDAPWAQGNLSTRFSYIREVHFKSATPTAPVFKVSMAKLVRTSPYFRRLLDEESRKPENEGATAVTVSYTDVLPGILRMMIFWVETGQLLETHTLVEYSTSPVEEDISPWMMMIRLYQAANRFEMRELKDSIMYKIADMVFATGRVPCGTLKTIYVCTKAGDGLRRLMIDLTAYKVPSVVYRTHFSSWTREILQDLLVAVKDARGEEPYAAGLMSYLSVI